MKIFGAKQLFLLNLAPAGGGGDAGPVLQGEALRDRAGRREIHRRRRRQRHRAQRRSALQDKAQ